MEKSKTTKREVFTKTGFILALILCATPYVSAPIALVGGFLFTLFFGHPYAKLNHKATNILLKASVVGLGFGMNVQSALQVGSPSPRLRPSSYSATSWADGSKCRANPPIW